MRMWKDIAQRATGTAEYLKSNVALISAKDQSIWTIFVFGGVFQQIRSNTADSKLERK